MVANRVKARLFQAAVGSTEHDTNFALNAPTAGRPVGHRRAVHPIVHSVFAELVHRGNQLLSPIRMDRARDLTVAVSYEVAESSHYMLRRLGFQR